MSDLRIVDAPVLLQESITDDVKMPTGGLGNFSIRLGDIVWYVVTKEQLANKNYVDLSSKGVKDSLDAHITDKANPHQVTKAQVGLGNVDNTADIDKPVSNAVSSAIITATTDMATKAYVNSKDGDLTTLKTADKTNLVKAINEVVSVKANKDDVVSSISNLTNNKADKATTLLGYGITDAYTKSEIDTNYGGVKTLYDKNVVAGAGANGWGANLVKDASGKTQQQINDASVKNGEFGSLLATTVKMVVNNAKASLKYGLKGAVGSFDDGNNNFRGLPKPTEPWADENTGIGSTMFGRDNATFAYLSMANGHGCSNFGVASFAGGAGSGTGNPDVPSDGATYGYCSLAYGKDTSAIGRISTAFGQGCKAKSLHSFSSGYESMSGKGSALHPVLSGTAVDDDGDCAFTHGFRAFAYGNYSAAIGNFVRAYHGSKVIGSGINAGSILEGLVPKSIVLGSGVDIPTIILTEDDVVANGAFGKVGFNTKYKPRERVEVVIKDGDKIAIRSSNNTAKGGGTLDLQGTLGTGNATSIFRIEYTSPNLGQAYGVTNFYQNGVKALGLNEYGEVTFEKRVIMKNHLDLGSYLMIDNVKILGGQQAAIPNSTGTAEDNARAINAILTAMRGHGLIAS